MSASTCTNHGVLPLLHDLLHFFSSLHVLIGVVAASVPGGLGERNESMSGDKQRETIKCGQTPSEFKDGEDGRRGRGKCGLEFNILFGRTKTKCMKKKHTQSFEIFLLISTHLLIHLSDETDVTAA